MVAAVHFFATESDDRLLLEHLAATADVRVFPWCAMPLDAPLLLTPAELAEGLPEWRYVGILNGGLGTVEFITDRPRALRPGEPGWRALDTLRWDELQPRPNEGIVDRHRTAALFWERSSRTSDGRIHSGNIGSQAESMAKVSHDYRRWVQRVMAWVRRTGTLVLREGRPPEGGEELDVRATFLNSIFALPGAMEFLRDGGGCGT